MDTLEAIRSRTSANNFDPTHELSNSEIEELIALGQEAPTSFNLQNWKAVVFRSKQIKDEVKAAAWGQAKVSDAAVSILFVGILDGHKEAQRLWQPLIDGGGLTEEAAAGLVGMANNFYADNAAAQRDEAIRSASLAGMTVMLAATAKGLSSGPMIGFDPVQVANLAGLGENEIPVLLLAVGRPAEGNWPRKPRRALSEQLTILD